MPLKNNKEEEMGYSTALAAAGAKVLAFETFGDYQGSWLAKVEYNGEVGWIEGSYGSCSGCDAFEAEFGYSWDEGDDYQQRLADFGRGYLHSLIPHAQQEDVIRRYIPDYEWGRDEYMAQLHFVQANA